MQVAAQHESERAVDANGALIAGQDVEKGCTTLAQDGLHGDVDEDAGKAATTSRGMRADGADLSELRQVETLAGHGKEGLALKDAPEAAELNGALAERAGFGESGQFTHGGNVGGSEAAHREGRVELIRKRLRWLVKDHLVERLGAQERPSGLRAGRRREKDDERLAGSGKCAERIITGRRRSAWGTERADLRQVARRLPVAKGEARVLRVQGAPDGVVERMGSGHCVQDDRSGQGDAEMR